MKEQMDSTITRWMSFSSAMVQPAMAKSVVEPVVVKPVVVKSAVTKPAMVQPAMVKSAVTKSVSVQPLNAGAEMRVRLTPEESVNRRGYGATYEDRARDYLSGLGYQFIAQNVNFKSGEIDLIFEQNIGRKVELVFVEVRKRSGYGWVSAEESVTFPKQRTLRNAITQYLYRYRGRASSMRIDLIAFQGEVIRHYPNFIH
jgi:putative endonuclease